MIPAAKMCIRDRPERVHKRITGKENHGWIGAESVSYTHLRPEDIPMVEEMFQKSPDISAFLLADHGVVAMGLSLIHIFLAEVNL